MLLSDQAEYVQYYSGIFCQGMVVGVNVVREVEKGISFFKKTWGYLVLFDANPQMWIFLW